MLSNILFSLVSAVAGFMLAIWVSRFTANCRIVELTEQKEKLEAENAAQKRMEIFLRENEEKYRTLAESIPDNVIRFDRDSRILYMNAQLLRALNVNLNDVIGKVAYEVFPDDLFPTFMEVRNALKNSFITGQSVSMELLLPKPNGEYEVRNTIITPERDPEGQIIGALIVGRNITEYKKLEASLLQREREFRTLAENLPSGVIRYDANLCVRYLNPQLASILNVDPDDLIGKLNTLIFPDEKHPYLRPYHQALKKCLASGVSSELEIFQPTPSDRHDIYTIKIAAERNETGQISGLLCVGHNITAYKQLELALRESESAFRSLAENSPDIILRYDQDCRAIYANPSFEKYVDLKTNSFIGRKPIEIEVETAESLSNYQKKIEQVIATGKSDQIELLANHPVGEIHLHQVHLAAERDNYGEIIGAWVMGRDISDFKKLEQSLRQREREFRSLADNFPYAIIRYDTEFRRIYANKAYENLTGVSVEEVINKTIDEVWALEKYISMEHYKQHLNKIILTQVPCNFYIQWTEGDGTINFREMYMVPEFDESNHIVSILSIGHNVNSYERAMHEMKIINDKLQTLLTVRENAREDERKHIAQEIHDELGQLLNVLRLNASTLDYQYGDHYPDLRTMTNNMMGIADQAIYSVRNLITQLRPAILAQGFGYAVECIVEDFSNNTGMEYVLEMPEFEIKMDEQRTVILFRIIQEGLTNIMRHSGASTINISMQIQSEQLMIKIHDNGCGFNTEAVYRADSFGIIGMQERVTALGGKIEINSTIGQGTEIGIRLPFIPLN